MTQFKSIKNMVYVEFKKKSTLRAFKFNGLRVKMGNKSFLNDSRPLTCGSKSFFSHTKFQATTAAAL